MFSPNWSLFKLSEMFCWVKTRNIAQEDFNKVDLLLLQHFFGQIYHKSLQTNKQTKTKWNQKKNAYQLTKICWKHQSHFTTKWKWALELVFTSHKKKCKRQALLTIAILTRKYWPERIKKDNIMWMQEPLTLLLISLRSPSCSKNILALALTSLLLATQKGPMVFF